MARFDRADLLDDFEVRSSRGPTKRPTSSGGTQPLLQLQRMAGNRAVVQLLSGGGPRALQVQRVRRSKDSKASGPKAPKGDKLEVDGVVQEALPNAMFRVRADNGISVLAAISGRMRQYYVKVLPGDNVTVEVSPYDPTRGHITYRHK